MPVCPICNGFTTLHENCPLCGQPLQDAGVIQDFYDDYSAYLEQDIYEDGYRHNNHAVCVHLFACPHCHFDTNISFRRLNQD